MENDDNFTSQITPFHEQIKSQLAKFNKKDAMDYSVDVLFQSFKTINTKPTHLPDPKLINIPKRVHKKVFRSKFRDFNEANQFLPSSSFIENVTQNTKKGEVKKMIDYIVFGNRYKNHESKCVQFSENNDHMVPDRANFVRFANCQNENTSHSEIKIKEVSFKQNTYDSLYDNFSIASHSNSNQNFGRKEPNIHIDDESMFSENPWELDKSSGNCKLVDPKEKYYDFISDQYQFKNHQNGLNLHCHDSSELDMRSDFSADFGNECHQFVKNHNHTNVSMNYGENNSLFLDSFNNEGRRIAYHNIPCMISNCGLCGNSNNAKSANSCTIFQIGENAEDNDSAHRGFDMFTKSTASCLIKEMENKPNLEGRELFDNSFEMTEFRRDKSNSIRHIFKDRKCKKTFSGEDSDKLRDCREERLFRKNFEDVIQVGEISAHCNPYQFNCDSLGETQWLISDTQISEEIEFTEENYIFAENECEFNSSGGKINRDPYFEESVIYFMNNEDELHCLEHPYENNKYFSVYMNEE